MLKLMEVFSRGKAAELHQLDAVELLGCRRADLPTLRRRRSDWPAGSTDRQGGTYLRVFAPCDKDVQAGRDGLADASRLAAEDDASAPPHRSHRCPRPSPARWRWPRAGMHDVAQVAVSDTAASLTRALTCAASTPPAASRHHRTTVKRPVARLRRSRPNLPAIIEGRSL
jgi:hypothetical protein